VVNLPIQIGFCSGNQQAVAENTWVLGRSADVRKPRLKASLQWSGTEGGFQIGSKGTATMTVGVVMVVVCPAGSPEDIG
jgi:hypothetical protein